VFHFARGLRLRKWIADIRQMTRFMGEARPDVVHVNGSQDHWVAGFVKMLSRRAMCLVRTRHNTYVVKDTWVNRYLNRSLTTFQICVCQMVRDTLSAQASFDGDRMTAIHNGVDASVYAPQADVRESAREMLGYGPEHLVCGIAARLVKAKGHTYLFQALESLQTDFPDLRLLILGQGALEESLKAQAAELGLDDMVQFGGFRTDMERCIQALDIGVLPSIDCDTSSFSLKEQMAAEIPVVTSDYGGLPEIVSDGDEGRVVPHGTVAPLTDALRALIENATLRRKMGQKGRERVLRDFTGEVFARRTVEAYERARELTREHSTS
tara:strand:- start:436 stop:1407 length:972 start_codon:yes stop_codon:yes gene_type:complete